MPKGQKPSKSTQVRAWIEIARDNLVAAQTLLEKSPDSRRSIANLAHQSAEKAIKALYAEMGYSFDQVPDIHSIRSLRRGLRNFDSALESYLSTADQLAAFAVQVRYPEFETPSKRDVRMAVEVAEQVFLLCEQRVRNSLEKTRSQSAGI